MVLGQLKVAEKSNEITAIAELLRLVGIAARVIAGRKVERSPLSVLDAFVAAVVALIVFSGLAVEPPAHERIDTPQSVAAFTIAPTVWMAVVEVNGVAPVEALY